MVIVPRIAAVSCLSTTPFLYGVAHEGNFRAELLLSDPASCVEAFSSRQVDFALVPAASVPALPDARIVTPYCVGGMVPDKAALLAEDDPFVAAWKATPLLPFAFAVWVAREDEDPDRIEALEQALTFGLEHAYEALLASPYAADAVQAYERLSHFDFIFDNQKNKALKKFWDSGLKITPRANPG